MKLFIKLLLFCFLTLTKGFAQDCELLAKYGTFDTKTVNLTRERAISFLDLFKRDTKMSYQEAKNYSATLGIPIGNILVELGMSASEESYKTFIESVQAMTTYDEYYIEKVQTVNRTVNKDIIEIIRDCYSQDGIHTRIESTEDKDIYYLTILFKWNGNHEPVKLKLTWEANLNDLTLNGKKYNKNFPFTIKNGEVIQISVKRNKNISIPFTLNLNNNASVVKIHSGKATIFKTKIVPAVVSSLKTIEIVAQQLSRTPIAVKIGNGDDELKRFSTTHLKDGNFSLGLESETKLIGTLDATIKEEASDWTEFRIHNIYPIYTAPDGYKIVSFKLKDNQSFTSTLEAYQSVWIKTEYVPSGPLSSYTWQGDTGNPNDQVEGCWIQPSLKDITIYIDKK